MRFERFPRVLGRPVPWCHAALAVCLLFAQVGCTKATTFGCAAGIGAGLGLAAAAAAGSNDPNLDAGAVVLGGGLFGVTSGCLAAAVADAVARGETKPTRRRSEHDEAPSTPTDGEQVAPTATADPDKDLVIADVTLDGMKVSWQGAPLVAPRRVSLRFQRYSSTKELSGCEELEIATGDRSVRVALFHDVHADPSAQPQVAHAEIDLAVIKELLTVKDTQLRLCGLTRNMTSAAVAAVSRFVAHFESYLPTTSAPTAVPSDCLPSDAASAGEGCR
jgi:hypothetical protein